MQEIVADWVKKIESPNGYPAMLFEPIVEAVQRKTGRNQPAQADAARTKAAFDAASQAAASVQSAVFNAVLSGNDEWKYSRWVLAFIDDSAKGTPAYVRQLEHGSFTTTWPRLVRDVSSGECMCTLVQLRLASRTHKFDTPCNSSQRRWGMTRPCDPKRIGGLSEQPPQS